MMKWPRKVTISILIAVALLLIGWDIYVAVNKDEGDTISEILLWVSKHPIMPFAFGVLMGHLFWPQKIKEEK
jgi:uncharacterized membrane protein